jgi:DNA-binding MurR/RpiR family transcriptional regulator
MELSDIAAGIEVHDRQRDPGVPTVDATGDDLLARLDTHDEALPCTPEAAANVLETYAGGTSVGDCARDAGVSPMTAAKLLHRCGVAGLSPLTPTAREVLRDWLAGDLSRTEAVELVGADEADVALATYIETHDAVPELADAVAGILEPESSATVAKRDALAETMSSVGDLR